MTIGLPSGNKPIAVTNGADQRMHLGDNLDDLRWFGWLYIRRDCQRLEMMEGIYSDIRDLMGILPGLL